MRLWWKTSALVVAALALLLAMPFIPAVISDSQFYGQETDLEVPQMEGAPVPENGLNVVFFGYRHCGTVCPVQLGNLRRLNDEMNDERIRFVFVTLDPERDSRAELNRIMASLGSRFVAVRPESWRAAQQLALSYGDMVFRNGAGRSDEIGHRGHLYVVTSSNRKHLTYSTHNLDLDRVRRDLRRLMAHQGRES
ncbi:MAG TPA: SCO family protein [Marinobacter sp.]|jgi:protein SCO1/2|nr:SCO family protein [Marinobacter sp.]